MLREKKERLVEKGDGNRDNDRLPGADADLRPRKQKSFFVCELR
jgi:hypothetical protein